MPYFILAFLIGFVAGLRSLTAPAVVSWAARLGWIHLENSSLAFLGAAVTPWIFTVLALAELVTDQLPNTPSRKSPPGFSARILMGALSGAAFGVAGGAAAFGAIAGVVGAIAGTFGGHAARTRLAAALGKDRPIAFLEDAIAIAGAILLASQAAGA
ncbi:MAG TPA: DUF4126 domain-containing protein [Bryobacteraceae bacterium]|jgi:uncharacterized membrane protein|nr:DUF4126 domain-containing protein [Bryobacteraceae bacterium]